LISRPQVCLETYGSVLSRSGETFEGLGLTLKARSLGLVSVSAFTHTSPGLLRCSSCTSYKSTALACIRCYLFPFLFTAAATVVIFYYKLSTNRVRVQLKNEVTKQTSLDAVNQYRPKKTTFIRSRLKISRIPRTRETCLDSSWRCSSCINSLELSNPARQYQHTTQTPVTVFSRKIRHGVTVRVEAEKRLWWPNSHNPKSTWNI